MGKPMEPDNIHLRVLSELADVTVKLFLSAWITLMTKKRQTILFSKEKQERESMEPNTSQPYLFTWKYYGANCHRNYRLVEGWKVVGNR